MTPILILAALSAAALCWLGATDWLAHLDRDTDEGPLGL